MSRTDEPEPVDFVVGDPSTAHPQEGESHPSTAAAVRTHDETHDEALDETPIGARHTTRYLVAAAVVVLALVLVGVLVNGRGHSAPTARSTPVVQPSYPTAPSDVPGFSVTVDPTSLQPLQACPEGDDGQPGCNTVLHVPAAFLAAVRARFPHVRQRSATTLVMRAGLSRPGLWSRSFTAGGGGLTVTVYVSRAEGAKDLTTALDDGAHTTSYSTQRNGSYTVQVQVVALTGNDLHDAAQRLALDPRLVAS